MVFLPENLGFKDLFYLQELFCAAKAKEAMKTSLVTTEDALPFTVINYCSHCINYVIYVMI